MNLARVMQPGCDAIDCGSEGVVEHFVASLGAFAAKKIDLEY